ncbi:AAA family ATPase [Sulfitobacter sp. F26169L]|uniref:AAA family ATPase n=1 Tax=Sulfitobacter sp. F26169L TaxID=2996015 RepID=UPI002260DB53|nr:AAA family ATPase [Sulfitobacter sp. F26169L]MCX7567158.1 AAA family ATPase [Sulfitobacter sp. F26169L]
MTPSPPTLRQQLHNQSKPVSSALRSIWPKVSPVIFYMEGSFMPVNTPQNPEWSTYADTLIDRLRNRHGVHFKNENEDPTELDILFQKLEGPEPAEHFKGTAVFPSRYVPARKMLAAIRIAATIGTTEVEHGAFLCGAITVIGGIPTTELETFKDTITDMFPSRWKIIEPDMTDGYLAKNAQSRFTRLVTDSLDKIEPLLVLQTDGIALPKALKIVVPAPLYLFPVTHDVILKFLASGHLADQAPGAGNIRAALPSEAELQNLSTVEICAALRAPILHDAITRLRQISKRDGCADGPRLEDMHGDSPALSAARRIVADLQAWKTGRVKWHEISHSLLLHGAPGTGKTWLARAMSNGAGVSLVTGTFGSWQSAGHLGDMLREMRETFSEARRNAPCILVIDEIDAVGSRIDPDRHASNYRTQVITTFLTELDQIGTEEGVIVVGTSNFIDRIDPAVIRSGRMDIKIEMPMPDADAILEILRFHLSQDIADHDLRSLSRRAVGQSAADIDAAIRAARSDARHARKMLSVEMLQAQMNVAPDDENQARTWRIAVHEAGHAVVAHALQIGHLDSITITGDGGNIACRIYNNESRLSDIENQITYSMAGRAAERLIIGEVSAGAGGPAHSDLALATRSAIAIETTYGLGLQGPVWHQDSDATHLGTPAIRDRVLQHIKRAETRAAKILQINYHFVEKLAGQLIKDRSMKAPTIARLLNGVTSTQADAPPNNHLN